MPKKILYKGQAVKSEMIVLMLEKWDLHPEMQEDPPDPRNGGSHSAPTAESERNGCARSENSPSAPDGTAAAVPLQPDPNDLERDTIVLVPETEYERAHEILFGESEVERAEF